MCCARDCFLWHWGRFLLMDGNRFLICFFLMWLSCVVCLMVQTKEVYKRCSPPAGTPRWTTPCWEGTARWPSSCWSTAPCPSQPSRTSPPPPSRPSTRATRCARPSGRGSSSSWGTSSCARTPQSKTLTRPVILYLPPAKLIVESSQLWPVKATAAGTKVDFIHEISTLYTKFQLKTRNENLNKNLLPFPFFFSSCALFRTNDLASL